MSDVMEEDISQGEIRARLEGKERGHGAGDAEGVYGGRGVVS